jgi:hypothetical protein
MGISSYGNANVRQVGVSEQCKEHLEKCKAPRILEVGIGLRSNISLSMMDLTVVPMLASYADDYPHGKFYTTCLEDIDDGIDLKSQEAPLERIDGGKAPFHKLDYPDNYFDVVISGYFFFLNRQF